jgi:dephospho-CoA kinase
MIVVGLTGSIGMGKSTVARMFADAGAMTWSADDAVTRLYAKGGGAVAAVGAAFPAAVAAAAVDRAKLADIVVKDKTELKRLEAIVHPLVGIDRRDFLKRARNAGAALVVLEIPLLFEGGYARGLDAVVVVSAPEAVQRARVIQRPGMSEKKLKAILENQTSDAEKRARADYVIETGGSLEATREAVARVVADLRRRSSVG